MAFWGGEWRVARGAFFLSLFFSPKGIFLYYNGKVQLLIGLGCRLDHFLIGLGRRLDHFLIGLGVRLVQLLIDLGRRLVQSVN